ncbi:MAG: metallophosphoesterase family protein [Desulfovibrionaceae bacterium]|nr:metallophosphoesterase family protein [Desulfovibrionaceae bacterium]
MPQTATIAVLADIHGNAAALRAVLDHARSQGATRFVNLGDTFYGPLDPAGTWAALKALAMDAVLGNQDRILLENDPAQGADPNPTLARTLTAIGADGLAWLKTLPAAFRPEPDILLCHGTPGSDTAYLIEDVSAGLPGVRPCADILADIPAGPNAPALVLAGHSHHAGLVRCGAVTVVNPGSVGLPAYADDDPPHVMAAGSPHARYALISKAGLEWKAELFSVEYDWKTAAALARENERPDWAKWLETGLA